MVSFVIMGFLLIFVWEGAVRTDPSGEVKSECQRERIFGVGHLHCKEIAEACLNVVATLCSQSALLEEVLNSGSHTELPPTRCLSGAQHRSDCAVA